MNSCFKFFTLSVLAFFSFSPQSMAQIGASPKVDTSRTNPALSVNALLLGRMNNKGKSVTAEAANGFHVQEVEAR